jgi:hypothetical protein
MRTLLWLNCAGYQTVQVTYNSVARLWRICVLQSAQRIGKLIEQAPNLAFLVYHCPALAQRSTLSHLENLFVVKDVCTV